MIVRFHGSFCYGEKSRPRKEETDVARHRAPLRSVDVDAILTPFPRPRGDVDAIFGLLESERLLEQPISLFVRAGDVSRRDDAMDLAVAITGKTVDGKDAERWLWQHNYKRVTTAARGDPCEAFSGAVWIHQANFNALFDPLRDAQQPIDRERIRALSDMWDKKEERGERLLWLCLLLIVTMDSWVLR